jgi:hypothetical protein
MPLPNSSTEFNALRAEYQKTLLAWLHAPESKEALLAMMAVLETLQERQPSCQPLTVATLDLLRAIREGSLPPEVPYRRLAARVDQALRKAARTTFVPDETLLRALRAPLAPLDPPPQAPVAPLAPRDPLASTLEATAAILPYVSHPREPRFTPQQRRDWDTAVHALNLAWEERREGWQALRRAVFKLLEGALFLKHPAPLKLAEALASATDQLESAPPAPRRLTALAATVELVTEADFLEHDALTERVDQLAYRLESEEEGPRSRMGNTLFAQEVTEEIEALRHALEAVPPDVSALGEAARAIQRLAEPLGLATLALTAFRFADSVSRLDPETLDHAPGRDEALAWIACLESWIEAIGAGLSPVLPAELALRQDALLRLAKTSG